MQESLLVAGAPLWTPLDEVTVLPRPPSWWGGSWMPPPQEPNPHYQTFGPLASDLTPGSMIYSLVQS